MDGKPQRHTFETLDAMRGIAALVVAGRHYGLVLPSSYLAVDLFFLLSGFVLQHAYGEALGKKLSGPTFLALRMARLYPLYVLGLAIGAWAYLVHGEWVTSVSLAFAIRLTFLPAPYLVPGPLTWFAFDQASWSLLFELFANFAHATLAARLSNRMLLIVIILSLIVVVGAAARAGSFDLGWYPTLVNFLGGFGRVGLSYFAGVAIYLNRNRLPTLPKVNPLWVLGAMVVCFSIPDGPSWYQIPRDLLFTAIVFPIIVYWGSALPITCGRILLPLGSASYGLYVLHFPLRDLFFPVYPGAVEAGLFLIGLTVACVALEQYYDVPARRALSLWFRGR